MNPSHEELCAMNARRPITIGDLATATGLSVDATVAACRALVAADRMSQLPSVRGVEHTRVLMSPPPCHETFTAGCAECERVRSVDRRHARLVARHPWLEPDA